MGDTQKLASVFLVELEDKGKEGEGFSLVEQLNGSKRYGSLGDLELWSFTH